MLQDALCRASSKSYRHSSDNVVIRKKKKCTAVHAQLSRNWQNPIRPLIEVKLKTAKEV